MIDEKAVNTILADLYKEDGYDCFASEAQLRDAFAIKVGMKYQHCKIIPEYTAQTPEKWKCSEKLIHFDLLIYDDHEKVLIEFKYKTKRGSFNIRNGTHVELHEQSDSTNGRYAIWRDIYRIETFANLEHIDKGFIVFITNNHTYYADPGKKTLAAQFSISPGMHKAGAKYWNTKNVNKCNSIHSAYRFDHQPLMIENDYFFSYEQYSDAVEENGKSHDFMQLILPIHSSSYANKIEKELRQIGKGIFVELYDTFKTENSKRCKEELSEKRYTPNSIDTRVGLGLRMFKEHRNVEALRHIITSSKVDEVIRMKAKELLRKELKQI